MEESVQFPALRRQIAPPSIFGYRILGAGGLKADLKCRGVGGRSPPTSDLPRQGRISGLPKGSPVNELWIFKFSSRLKFRKCDFGIPSSCAPFENLVPGLRRVAPWLQHEYTRTPGYTIHLGWRGGRRSTTPTGTFGARPGSRTDLRFRIIDYR